MKQPRKYHFKIVKILILSAILVIVLLIAENYFSNLLSTNQPTEASLRNTYYEIANLITNKNFGEEYDKFVPVNVKAQKSKEQYVREMLDKSKNRYNMKFEILDLKIFENKGYVFRSMSFCTEENCKKPIVRNAYKEYIFDNGRWLPSGNEDMILCIRQADYEMPEEFKRSISLIIQRFSQGQYEEDRELADGIKNISNCLNIQYASSEGEFESADGYFKFSKGDSLDKLNIIVSRKYQAKDDILTASLLTHEITHAIQFLMGVFDNEEVPCFENEALAFNNQNAFIAKLNPEEFQSLQARLTLSPSIETQQIFYVLNEIPKYSGKDNIEKAENFVKANLVYQKQCSSQN